MLIITPASTDPYFNIASEEYILKNFPEDIFMLYCNESSIIVGKHQNTFGEINYRYTREHNIKVVRRLSGGGTVFHDAGNLNFCFIRNGQEGNLIDFSKYIRPIIEVLQKIGVPAEQSGRNDILINGLKFSGNAEHVYKNRVMHHGTLLFSSELGSLREALKVKHESYQDKAVKSVRSPVTNITDHLLFPISLDEFKAKILSHISTTENASFYSFSDTDTIEIQKLMKDKYRTWEWNFGYSPKFIFRNEGTINEDQVQVELEIEKGIIKHAAIRINGLPDQHITESLMNKKYREDEIGMVLEKDGLINLLL